MENTESAALPVALPAYGIEHIEKILDVAVSGFEAFKSVKTEQSTMQKVAVFVPTLMLLAGALEDFSKAGPEFKDMSGDEIQALADKYGPKFGVSGKAAVYVKEGANILASGFRMLKAK